MALSFSSGVSLSGQGGHPDRHLREKYIIEYKPTGISAINYLYSVQKKDLVDD